jgi:hypothetical protein
VIIVNTDHDSPLATQHFGQPEGHRALAGAGVADNADNDGLGSVGEIWLQNPCLRWEAERRQGLFTFLPFPGSVGDPSAYASANGSSIPHNCLFENPATPLTDVDDREDAGASGFKRSGQG